MNPFISFIIPFFGKADEKLLERCLRSVHEQKMEKEEYEIIIANGNNIGHARNNGLEKANGEYVCFIDADDYLLANHMAACLEKLRTEKPDLLSFQFIKVSPAPKFPGKKAGRKVWWSIYETGSGYMADHNITGAVWKHLIKRSLIAGYRIRFVENTFQEDEAFMAKVYLYAGKTIISNYILYAYTYQPDSLVNNKIYNAQRIKDTYTMLVHLSGYGRENATALTQTQKKALGRRLNFLTIDYMYMLVRKRTGFRFIRKELKALRNENLVPLPVKNYSWKYVVCSSFINLFAL